MKRYLLATLFVAVLPAAFNPEYSIQAILLANSPGDSVADFVMGAPKGEKVYTVAVMWLIRGGGRNILFDSGFHRDCWFEQFPVKDYLPPDEAVRLAGVAPEEVTDVVISHTHWDHMGGIDRFPTAIIWIQKEEFRHYTGPAWQPGGNHGGIDPDDVQQLVRLNTEGRLRLVDGDNVEIPGFGRTRGPGTLLPRSICESMVIRRLADGVHQGDADFSLLWIAPANRECWKIT